MRDRAGHANLRRGKWSHLARYPGGMLGFSPGGTHDLVQRIEAGFGFGALERFGKTSGLPLATIADILRIPPRTLARRKATGRLRPEESERLLRFSNLFSKAMDLFEGDVAAVHRWLTRPNRALGYVPPLSYAKTEVGAREVEDLIMRLEHGIFS